MERIALLLFLAFLAGAGWFVPQAKAQDQANDAIRQKEQAQSDMAASQAAMASNQAASAAAVSAAQADADQSRLVLPE